MKTIKKRFKVLILSFIVLLAILAGGFYYLNDYYHAGSTAARRLENPDQGVIVTRTENDYLVFTPLYSPQIKKALIFYPGAKVEYTAYVPLMEKLAGKGVLCVLLKMPANFALLKVNAAESILEKYPDIKEWYIAGHSLGGVAAAMNMEKNAWEYKGIVFLGSYSSVNLNDTELRALSIYGDQDGVMNRAEYEKCGVNLPADFREEIIKGGNHAGFGDYGIQRGDGLGIISSEEQQQMTADIIAEWMKEK